MKTQILKKACTIFMIVAICIMMLSAQISLSANVEKCVNHCILNQCMKVSGKQDSTTCEVNCKTFCNKQPTSHEEYIVRTPNGLLVKIKDYFCEKMNTCS
ncbi:unnamed protein product [Brassica oleracea var. botrytis]|uniref:Plant thionin family protein n=1 Tax=Brassica cretica TaxID=69181 RepID=A0A8S9S1F5_BRACR|nr:hypothetical protein F2Q69_00031852 [Brassica cretica]